MTETNKQRKNDFSDDTNKILNKIDKDIKKKKRDNQLMSYNLYNMIVKYSNQIDNYIEQMFEYIMPYLGILYLRKYRPNGTYWTENELTSHFVNDDRNYQNDICNVRCDIVRYKNNIRNYYFMLVFWMILLSLMYVVGMNFSVINFSIKVITVLQIFLTYGLGMDYYDRAKSSRQYDKLSHTIPLIPSVNSKDIKNENCIYKLSNEILLETQQIIDDFNNSARVDTNGVKITMDSVFNFTSLLNRYFVRLYEIQFSPPFLNVNDAIEYGKYLRGKSITNKEAIDYMYIGSDKKIYEIFLKQKVN